jgi:hypothetical protein
MLIREILRAIKDTKTAPIFAAIGWAALLAAAISVGMVGAKLINDRLDPPPVWPPLVDEAFTGMIDGEYLHYTFTVTKVVPYGLKVVNASWERIDGALYGVSILERDGTITTGDALVQEGDTITASFRVPLVDWVREERVGYFRYCWTYDYPDALRTHCRLTPIEDFEFTVDVGYARSR